MGSHKLRTRCSIRSSLARLSFSFAYFKAPVAEFHSVPVFACLACWEFLLADFALGFLNREFSGSGFGRALGEPFCWELILPFLFRCRSSNHLVFVRSRVSVSLAAFFAAGFVVVLPVSVVVDWFVAGCAAWNGVFVGLDRKSTRLNSSHIQKSRMPSSA